MNVRIPVLSGEEAAALADLLQSCGHEPLTVPAPADALAAAGGGVSPLVVVPYLGDGTGPAIAELQRTGTWVLGAGRTERMQALADAGADDLLTLPAGTAAMAARIRLAQQSGSRSRLLMTERLASVGTLASGVAHEINNPLAVTMANLEYALGELTRSPLPGHEETVQALRDAYEGADRVRKIVRDLHTFSRTDSERRDALDVNAVVESVLAMASNELKHRARVVKELGDVPYVHANEQRLGQVVLNLLMNAAQAIPVGHSMHNEVRVRTAREDGHVVLEIADTGSGIAPQNLSRIFDPFFTTKEPGQGTGLGLALCHTIVTSLGGEIRVESEPGKGSTFRVLLPASRARARTPTPEPAPAPRRARILLVDDEPLLGRMIERTLGTEHEVKSVTSARDALSRIQAGERYEVIVCDLMMPDMTGMELHAILGAHFQDQQRRLVFVTGGAFTAEAQRFLERVPWLAKPFGSAALRALIAQTLARE